MYEANEVSLTRRIVVLAITGVAIVAIVWFTVWFIFFRNHHTSETPASGRNSQSQTEKQSSDTNSSSSSSSSDNNTAPNSSSSGTTGTASSTATTTPALANTGPGNVVTPVLVAMVVGSSLYYVRVLRTARG